MLLMVLKQGGKIRIIINKAILVKIERYIVIYSIPKCCVAQAAVKSAGKN